MLVRVEVGVSIDPNLVALLRVVAASFVVRDERLTRIEAMLEKIQKGEEQMALDLSKLQTELTRETDVVTAVSTLLDRLTSAVEANKNDPAALQAVVDQYKAQNDALAAAVAKNTPAEVAA